jgi:hypothetical protein
MILKPGKDPTDVTSYRPISLLPVTSKILEKLLLSTLTKEFPLLPDMATIAPVWIPERALYNSSMPPAHQYHSQSLRRPEILPSSLSRCKPSFDKVWHPGLLLKIQQTLPQQYFTLLQSYLQHCYLEVSYKNAT